MTSDRPPIPCSFCGRDHKDVKKLFGGPCVQICDECVRRCHDVLAVVEDDSLISAESSSPSAGGRLRSLSSLTAMRRSLDEDIDARVEQLRDEGETWSRIAQALGVEEAKAARTYSSNNPESE